MFTIALCCRTCSRGRTTTTRSREAAAAAVHRARPPSPTTPSRHHPPPPTCTSWPCQFTTSSSSSKARRPPTHTTSTLPPSLPDVTDLRPNLVGRHSLVSFRPSFLSRPFLPARRYASACTSYSHVCLPQVGVLSKPLNESSWFLAGELSSSYPTLCCREIQVPSKKKGTSLWNFAPNFGLRKFRHSICIAEACYQLRQRKVDAQSVINWAVVGQLS